MKSKEVTVLESRENTITEILGHDVSWFTDSDNITELDEASIERIENCINDGCKQGELSVGHEEARGWWHIINWRDIACQLYHQVPTRTPEQKEARKRFNDEWTF